MESFFDEVRVVRKTLCKRRSLRFRWICGLVTGIAVFLFVFVKADAELRPMIQNYGTQTARRSAMLSVHRGVEQVLAEAESNYGDLITVTRGDGGEVLSAEANVPAINLLKAKATDAVIKHLGSYENQIIRIPFGSLLGGSFFTGRGPFLKFNIHSNGSAITSLYSTFTDAGINQTCHRIYLKMTVMMSILLPLERRSVQVEPEFLVCETVLVGEVPEAYADLNLGEAESLCKIFGADD